MSLSAISVGYHDPLHHCARVLVKFLVKKELKIIETS